MGKVRDMMKAAMNGGDSKDVVKPFRENLDFKLFGGPEIDADDFDYSELLHKTRDTMPRKHFHYEHMLKRIMRVIGDDPSLLVAVLKDQELSEWYSQEREVHRRANLKRTAMNKLTLEEQKELGLK